MSRSNRLLRPAASALTLLAALSAHAAPAHLRLVPTFGNALLPGGWQEMTVQVDNPADGAPIDGSVTLQLRDPRYPGRFDASFSTRLTIAPGASAVAKVPIRVPQESMPNIVLTLQDGVGDRARVLASKLFDGIPARGEGLNVLAVTPSGDPSALAAWRGSHVGLRRENFTLFRAAYPFSSAHPGVEAAQAAQPVIPIPLPQANLPTDPLAYDPIVAIALGPGVALTPAQRTALDAFVRRGGVVLDADHLAVEELRDALTAQVGVRPVRLDLETPEDGMAPLQDSLLRHKGLEAPPFGTLLIFLAGYLILAVPVQYTVLRRIDRRELAWVVTPALAVGFSIAAYSFARVGRPTAISYNVASVVETVSGSPTATQTGTLGLYSPASARYDVTLSLPQAAVWHQDNDASRFVSMSAPDRATAQGLTISQWSVQPIRFRSEAIALGAGVALKVDYDASTGVASVHVHNGTSQTLREARLRLGRYVLPLGSIAAGADARARQALPSPSTWGQNVNAFDLIGGYGVNSTSLQSLAYHIAAYPTSRPMLVAQVDAPVPVSVDGQSVPAAESAHFLTVLGSPVE